MGGTEDLSISVEVPLQDPKKILVALERLEAYAKFEPRLRSAQWVVGSGPTARSIAQVQLSRPFGLSVLARLFGDLKVEIELQEWNERGGHVTFRSGLAQGVAALNLGRETAELQLRLTFRSRLVATTLRPLRVQLAVRAERSARNALGRAEAFGKGTLERRAVQDPADGQVR